MIFGGNNSKNESQKKTNARRVKPQIKFKTKSTRTYRVTD